MAFASDLHLDRKNITEVEETTTYNMTKRNIGLSGKFMLNVQKMCEKSMLHILLTKGMFYFTYVLFFYLLFFGMNFPGNPIRGRNSTI